jgi:oligopeptide/dipeptide ABC transporter ATP-binding protein
MTEQPAIRVRDLAVHFPIARGVLGRTVGHVRAVDGVSFEVHKGEVFALVGESGCGKTTTAFAVLNLVKKTHGTIALNLSAHGSSDVQWDALSAAEKRSLRKSVQVVFQDPMSSLNPRMTVKSILEEPYIVHRMGSPAQRDEWVRDLMQQVGLSPDFSRRFPHEFSGGQRQRIGIARALATKPEIVIADEPVSSLDVSIQAQIVNLLQDLQRQRNLTLMFISHDLAIVRHIANRMAVMYLGRIMEMGTDRDIFENPQHPYTELLLSSVSVPGSGRRGAQSVPAIDEQSESGSAAGCPFYPRCPKREDECMRGVPQLREVSPGHVSACVETRTGRP